LFKPWKNPLLAFDIHPRLHQLTSEIMSVESLTSAPVSPKDSPLPPVPAEDPITKDQWRTLLSLADCIIPSIQPSSIAQPTSQLAVSDPDYGTALGKIEQYAVADGGNGLAKKYLEEKASDIPAFTENLRRILTFYVPTDMKKEFQLGLTLLK
jgi:hypothetical protein